MRLILSTRNSGKTGEIRQIMAPLPAVRIFTLDEARIKGNAVEDGPTLTDNAAKKAEYAFKRRPSSYDGTIGEDTGLFIGGLGGKPGIYTARWAGEGATQEQIVEHALREMAGIANREAIFKTDVILMLPNGSVRHFEGSLWGVILESPQGEAVPGLPYSRIFAPKLGGRSLAEMSSEQRNVISHRGRAFGSLRRYLSLLLSTT